VFKRSLYVRIVRTFILAVIISLLSAYFISSHFFHHDYITENELKQIINGTVEIIEKSEPEKLPAIVETMQTYYFDLIIVDQEGVSYVGKPPSFSIAQADIERILHTDVQVPFILPYSKRDPSRVAGSPIEIMGQEYALIIHFNYEDEIKGRSKTIIFTLVTVLFIGSLVILFVSRHLVNPIKELTIAAKEIAKGNFSVRLKSKNKDEVGQLISSFNHMATEVEKIDHMRKDFVSNVSHEIQSPLTSIKGFTKALRDEVIPKQEQQEYLDIIYQETERLSRLSENLLRLASLDSEHHPYEPEEYRLDEQLRRMVLKTEPQWKKKSHQIYLDLEPIELYADQDLLDQVWLNLMTNAIKYSDENDTIIVKAKRHQGVATVRVEDSGKGIPKEEIPNNFDRFYKVDKARSSKMDGSGLGLSIVKKIVALHQGSIAVKSEEGKGSVFIVSIPEQRTRNNE
jgi:signal transduction histidine kinase